jgi:hypothetical protein
MLTSTSRFPTWVRCSLALALLVLFAPTAPAQCFGPDFLDIGNCCQPAQPNLPDFPPVLLPALGICWKDCAVDETRNLRVDITPPGVVTCGQYVSELKVLDDLSGAIVLEGALVLDYTRTWIETMPSGDLVQVWRFVAKVDLISVGAGAFFPCVTPECVTPAGPYQRAFYYGYMDFAGCDGPVFGQNALVLYHNCDRFIHADGLSDKPGTFHPGRSYALVAPHSALQPFVPGNAVASGGPLLAEATRNVNAFGPPPSQCMVEDRVVEGTMLKLGAGCVCSLSTTPKQQTVREFFGQTACLDSTGMPGSWTSVDLGFPLFPWLHVVTTSIGRWTNGNVYPGKERCWVDEGVFAVLDACTGDFAEIKYGASTRAGWTPELPLPVLSDDFTDMADNYTAPLLGPYPGPYVGSVQPTEHLIYVNLP